ncbi:MAG: hypothetical protein U1C58_06305 [Flavobacteriaceae bacterium]|nr:hypothetical protein [Flavobacteriaceae bacterium]
MTLDDATFIAQIEALQDEMLQDTYYTTAKQQYAQKLLLAIKAYLISGTVDITGTSSQGAFTGTGNIS